MSYDSRNPYAAPPTQAYPPTKMSNGTLATLGQRFLGGLIDGLIMMPISFVIGFVLGMALAVVGMATDSFLFNIMATILGSIFGIGVFLAVNGYFLAKNGQTIGKMVIGTRIVADDGSLVPFPQLILKRYLPLWLVCSIPFVGAIFALINALLIFRENRKCGHDEIAGTKVVVVAK